MELGVSAAGTVPDVAIVAEAWTRWRHAAWRRLVGDWSAAVWDPASQEIALACDFMGVRPLFYVVTGDYCAWSTALEGLVALTGRRQELDEVYFACSVMRSKMPGHTPYRDIQALIPGHQTHIRRGGAREMRQFWQLPSTSLRYQNPRDYQVHLRAMFAQAVSRRLRSDRPIYVELSGGWDSSAIVCMAALLAGKGESATPALTTASYVLPGDRESDETRFIEAVESHVQLPCIHLELDRASIPVVPNPVHFRTAVPQVLSLYERMRSRGAVVLMSGRLGDGVLGNFPHDVTHAAEALRRLQWMAAARELRAWSLGTHETAWSLLAEALAGFLPARVIVRRDAARTLASIVGATATVAPEHAAAALGVPRSLVSHFYTAREIHTRWCLRERQPWRSGQLVAALGLYALNQELASPPEAQGIALTYPIADRDLVEFAAAIPAGVLCEPGRPRALMRDALGPLLPERIRRRFSKGYAGPFHARLVREQAPSLLARWPALHVIERGYIDPASVLAQFQSAMTGGPHSTGLLMQVLAIETWLSAMTSDNSAAA